MKSVSFEKAFTKHILCVNKLLLSKSVFLLEKQQISADMKNDSYYTLLFSMIKCSLDNVYFPNE